MDNKNNDKFYNQEEVIQRLIDEQNQTASTLKKIKNVINSTPEFQGLTVVGGVKAILQKYKNTKEKVFQLERQIKKITHSKDKEK